MFRVQGIIKNFSTGIEMLLAFGSNTLHYNLVAFLIKSDNQTSIETNFWVWVSSSIVKSFEHIFIYWALRSITLTANLVNIILPDHKLLNSVCVRVLTRLKIHLILGRFTLQVLWHPIVLGCINSLIFGDWINWAIVLGGRRRLLTCKLNWWTSSIC